MANPALDKSFEFAVRIVNMYKLLCNDRKEFVLSKQVLRSGTSIGANLSEAVRGISSNDFLNKVYISLKECTETRYWLKLLYRTDYLDEHQFKSIDADCAELEKILTATTKTITSKIAREKAEAAKQSKKDSKSKSKEAKS